MKKSKIFILVGIIFLCTLIILFVFKGREWFPSWNLSFLPNFSGGTQDSAKQVGDPDLEITMVEFPGQIDSICQRVEFKVEVMNVGWANLKFSDFETGKYAFSLLEAEKKTIIAQTLNNSQNTHNLYINEFQELKPGEKTTLSFYTKETYAGGGDFGYQNGFNMLQSNGNGTKSFIFQFVKNNGKDSYTMISNREEFAMDIEAFEMSSGTWTNKICN